jgi:hypothetical protein
MSLLPDDPDHHPDPTPFLAYFFYAITLMALLAATGIIWGITQDANWHGFGGITDILTTL